MTTIVEGSSTAQFEPVRSALAQLLTSGQDFGASVAVTVRGELVADLWGGHIDTARTLPWHRDTIVNVFSTTKTMTNLCALLLADCGDLDVDAPVDRYWPEFKANGKEDVLVRHVLGHSSGLSGWDATIELADLCDWERCTTLLAAQSPWWEPGTMSGYHALTQGYLVGEIVRRITGQTLGEFFARELAAPLNADFYIGTSAANDARIAPMIEPQTMSAAALPAVESETHRRIMTKTLLNGVPPAETSRTPEWRRAEIPAANGHGNARSVAAIQSIVSNLGAANGTRLLSEDGCRRIFRTQSNGIDAVLGVPIRFGVGFGLPNETTPFPSINTCFWGGWGGSLVVNDLDAHMTIAYVMNKMGPGTLGDERAAGIVLAAYSALLAESS
jgi:CubicO group peptidase (beta-lactamase class C family)